MDALVVASPVAENPAFIRFQLNRQPFVTSEAWPTWLGMSLPRSQPWILGQTGSDTDG